MSMKCTCTQIGVGVCRGLMEVKYKLIHRRVETAFGGLTCCAYMGSDEREACFSLKRVVRFACSDICDIKCVLVLSFQGSSVVYGHL